MSDFKPPSWAGTPESGLHLDVVKDGVLVEKFAVDGKNYYLFGRNADLVDFVVDHASCSRVHAALVHHKALKRPFLMDLSSTHGTFVGAIRLEANTPQQLFPDTSFHFGASTRIYSLREKPKAASVPEKTVSKLTAPEITLPATQVELDTLTTYNTEQNVRLANAAGPIPDKNKHRPHKRKQVSFTDEEEVINLGDTDPSVGKFQNLVATEVLTPSKKVRVEPQKSLSNFHRNSIPLGTSKGVDLYGDMPNAGIGLPNSAPDVDLGPAVVEPPSEEDVHDASHHKKYAKEIWPGKAPHRNDRDI